MAQNEADPPTNQTAFFMKNFYGIISLVCIVITLASCSSTSRLTMEAIQPARITLHGNLETAAEWASKSYSDYRNKEGLRYANLLRDRMAEERLLHQQWSR